MAVNLFPVTLEWGPIECTCEDCYCKTLVRYREQGGEWITPTNPENPTPTTSYVLYIEANKFYEVQLDFIGPLCAKASLYVGLYYPFNNCCPPGWTLNDDGTYCYKIEETAATPPSGPPSTLVQKTHAAYSTCGTWIYDLGYNMNGTGSSTQIPTSNAFWINGVSNPGCVDNFPPTGPMNRAGLWATTEADGQSIGFSVCINIPTAKIYYVGVGSDNYSVIKLDSLTLVEQNDVALSGQYPVGLAAPFKVWHVYPVQISAGPHILEVYGHNVWGPAAMGVEVYDATPAELAAATSYADLGPKLIFSSKDEFGEPVQFGTGGAGYTCPDTFALATCADPIICRRILYTSVIPC